ncbi:MAG: type III-A CRISPR-associated RAMP protein Csm4 [Candidatus Woesearchaeota archaeon]
MKLIKLIPGKGSKFHFGTGKLNTTEIIFHSDSLFSAIINNYVKLFNDYPNNIPLISSVFPFSNNTLYFPKPYYQLSIGEEFGKKIKKIQFVSKEIIENFDKKIKDFEINDIFLCYKNEDKPIIRKILETKVKISKPNNIPYDIEFFEISNGGLFFLIDGEIDYKLEEAIKLIKYEGLGGERSSGKGLFNDIKIEDFNFKSGEKEDLYYSISLISPLCDEYNYAISYNLIERKGFIYSPFNKFTYRKNPLIMFSEGSLFSKKINGTIRRVATQNDILKHDVFRDGRAFLLRLNKNEN